MFTTQSGDLEHHLQTSKSIKSSALILAEWNMNDAENVEKLGNYRSSQLMATYDPYDRVNAYTGATESDVEIEGPYDVDPNNPDDPSGVPTVFLSRSEKNKMLYSLDDCLKPNRPRSGINYMQWIPRKRFFGKMAYTSSERGSNTVHRPRYYMAAQDAHFKYWSSLRYDGATIKGMAKEPDANGNKFIEDANPFVAYKNPVPSNKLVVKMQTHIGTVRQGDNDPFYGQQNSATPSQWKIQGLVEETVGGFVQPEAWKDLISFDEGQTRSDGTPIIKEDGYVELSYGIKIPKQYTVSPSGYVIVPDYIGEIASVTSLPETALNGEYYLCIPEEGDRGVVYYYYIDANEESHWKSFVPEYGWQLVENYDVTRSRYIDDLTNPASFIQAGINIYRDFQYLRGIRLVCTTMNKAGATLDLIEMSPRLVVDVTDRTVDINAKKAIGSVDSVGLPLGGLVAGTGRISIFDDDDAFNENNSNSIIANFLNENIAFSIYDVVKGIRVGDVNASYYVPVKTLYSEGIYPSYANEGTISFDLRDFFYYFENTPAPEIMIRNVSLSVAIALLLDSAGFSNYVFYRAYNDIGNYYPEPIIPYFFIGKDKNVAEVLEELAVATQSAMFFDEYNNFVVMFKEYIMGNRAADLVLHGNDTYTDPSGATQDVLPDIVGIASSEKKTFNSGSINYTERYIQRSAGSLLQAGSLNVEQNLKYLPALLWEVGAEKALRTINNQSGDQSGYVLSAVPLQFDLSADVPTISGGRVINNVLDVGENAYMISSHDGYLFANGEIIRYDALQYHVQGTGNVWISSNDEYQEYVSNLPFGGKIYATGKVRIFTEVRYRTDQGEDILTPSTVKSHGRGQFNTPITFHNSGLNPYWVNSGNAYDSTRGMTMQSQYLFDDAVPPTIVAGRPASFASDVNTALTSNRYGVIKNFLRNVEYSEADGRQLTPTSPAAIQSSAFNLLGPQELDTPRDFLTMCYKNLADENQPFRHFGTRMRVIGQLNAASDTQNPVGETSYYPFFGNESTTVLTGGSGGIFFGVNPETLNGYYLELIALSNNGLDLISGDPDNEAVAHNIVFYKVGVSTIDNELKAVPVKLWGGLTNVVVDNGNFTGLQRNSLSDQNTVYDLSVEYERIGSFVRFYIYLNNQQVATVDDTSPLTIFSSSGMFVRGASHCMFENFFAIGRNISDYGDFPVVASDATPKAFGLNQVSANDVRQKVAISGVVQQSYVSGISPASPNTYRLYYDEFGTIMRECAYFNIKYDKAFPALWSQISPTFNDTPGYIVSGYTANAYGAKFLIFNMTDALLKLDDTSGNYLRIQGIAFTQSTSHDYTMDQYFGLVGKTSDLSDDNSFVLSSATENDQYRDVRINRIKYGKKDFSLSSDYIQTQAAARNLMGWLADKALRNRLQVGIEIFNNPLVQLGDVININYSLGGVEKVIDSSVKFVVYNVEYTRGVDGPSMTVYASEV